MKIISNKLFFIILIFTALLVNMPPAWATKDFYIKNNSQTYFYVNGTSGNVGIGSLTPGQILDVQGTVRTTAFTMTGQTPASGYVLTASDSAGDTTWTPAGTSSGWTVSGNNVYETAGGNVGIGTTLLTTSALTVMNGNVGIGTWVPLSALDLEGAGKSIGIGTTNQASFSFYSFSPVGINYIAVQSGLTNGQSAMRVSGDIGGATNYGQMTYENSGRTYNTFTTVPDSLSLQTGSGVSGGIILVSQGAIAPIIFVTGGQALSNERMRIDSNGNVGIGTSNPFGGGLIVTNGNVGIGSLVPGQKLDVQGTVRTTAFTMSGQTPVSGYVLTASDSAGDTTWTSAGAVSGWTISGNNVYETNGGNVGIGTTLLTTSALTVMNGNVGIGTWKPGNFLEIVGGNVGISTIFNSSLVGVGTTSTILTMQRDTGSIYVGWQAGASVPVGVVFDDTALGSLALNQNSGGTGGNTAVGWKALSNDITGISNTAVGGQALSLSTGNYNTAVGLQALSNNSTGTDNSALGWRALENVTGSFSDNTAFGYQAGTNISGGTSLTSPSQSTFLGDSTEALANNDTNEIVIGYNAVGNGSNTVTIGNTSVISTILGGNVGIGTFYTVNQLNVNGAVGIGTANSAYVRTLAPSGGMIIQGNVGISSLAPGLALDVQGSVRMLGFTLTGNGAAPGSVLVTNNIGLGSWMPVNTIANAGFINQQTANQIPYYNSPNPSTTLIGSTNFVFNIPNVGIGTTTPLSTLQVVGNIGISTLANGDNFVLTSPPKGGIIVETNVGIGTWAPTKALSVTGDSYHNGNIGIGTLSTTTSALTVMNGDVGIGTWAPSDIFQVSNGTDPFVVDYNGNVGVGTILTSSAILTVMSGNVGIGTWVPAYNLDLVNNTARERVVRRINTEASGSPVTINTDQTDLYTITALAVNLTFNAPTGTPNNGDLLEIRILDNGTARTLTWTTGAAGDFLSTTTSLPATTVVSTTLRVLVEWNSASSRWECIGVT